MKKALVLIALVLNGILLSSILFSDQGLFACLEARNRQERMVAVVEGLDEESVALSREILLLRDDPDYLERIIRQQMHFVQEDEVLYIFPKPSDEVDTGAHEDG